VRRWPFKRIRGKTPPRSNCYLGKAERKDSGRLLAAGIHDFKNGNAALLDSATNLREHIVGVRSDEADSADDDDENYSQHHRVLSNVLTTFIIPKLL